MAKNKPKSHRPSLPPSTTLPATVTPILSHLYLSPASATSPKSTPSLLSHGITTIISVGKSPLFQHPDITYHRLPLLDSENVPLGPTIEKTCAIIDDVEAKGEKVLVHCSAGISRSPAVVAGYLISRKGMGLDDAMGVIKEGRGVVKPSKGFLEELGTLQTDTTDEGGDEGKKEEAYIG
ncbi:protein-tyrosine phosphatase-like protein [Cercophora samala]|uniref:protein-tyrosine-phosphatase n=1 Tax=Cercophora samala TaxID=330535 RepID=A0AA39ZFX3_9PEZI|nr:protein-tyrosine phosphatase-like protein [Cercophora samala]